MELEHAQVEEISIINHHLSQFPCQSSRKKCPEILLVAKLRNVGLQSRKCGFEITYNI